MKKIVIILTACLMMGISAFAQDAYFGGIDKQLDIRSVFAAKAPVFYGYDFSGMRVTNYNLLGKDRVNRKFFYSWINFMTREVNPYTRLPKWLSKYEMVVVDDVMMDMVAAVPEEFIQGHSHRLEYEDIEFAVNNYKIEETQGVGFVFNVENFNRQKKYASMYATFFDIETRQILWCVELRSKDMKRGMDGWSEAMLDCVKQFVDDHYKPKN